MSTPNYRILVSFDKEQNTFRARAPELEPCFAEAGTRAEAIAQLEQEIEAKLHNMAQQGKQPPRAVDEEEWTGEVHLSLSKSLQKDLTWLAKLEGVEFQQLVSELLAAGLEQKRQVNRTQRQPQRAEHGNEARPQHPERNYRGDRPHRNQNYSHALEDRANFIQYLRGKESAGTGRDGGQRGNKNHRNDKKNHRRPGQHPRNRQEAHPVAPATDSAQESMQPIESQIPASPSTSEAETLS